MKYNINFNDILKIKRKKYKKYNVGLIIIQM